jgi:uncharacterized CHY-type Zn-finger protein
MKTSFINRITLCQHCRKAFIINEEGNESECDFCLAETEITHRLIDDGDLIGINYDCP